MSIVRVAQGEYPLIAQALDTGVSGIIVPRVETVEQMGHILDCAKFPPVGKRGFGFRSSHLGKRGATMAERVKDQNEGRFLFIQIESRRGLENFESILDRAGDWINGVFLGPADFQMDLGTPDRPDAPELEAAARHITSVCAMRNLSSGVPAGTVESAEYWRGLGFNLITVGNDEGFLWSAATNARDALQALERD
jgi:2-dehydro-3-deoxyglucarate aldolase/4-hydroxy-2-oxoheptanedioate aldolase